MNIEDLDYLQKAIEEARQEGRKEVVDLANRWRDLAEHGDYSNGVEAFGVDEGRVRTWDYMRELEKEWEQQLKSWGLEVM